MTPGPRFSIRRYLLAAFMGVVALGMTVTGWLSYRSALYEMAELFDAQLAQSARVLMATLSTEPLLMQAEGDTVVFPAWQPQTDEKVIDHEPAAEGHEYETRLVFQLWEGRGEQLLMRSDNASPQPLAEFAPGIAHVQVDGRRAHVFVLEHEGTWLQVAQDDYMRDELAGEVALATFLPLLLGFPLIGLLAFLLVGRGLLPLERLRGAIAGRGADNLGAVRIERSTVELQPVVDELNRLLARLQESFARERRFTADAAHELRTPLAALRIQAENAVAATDEPARRQALGNLLHGVDRATRVVSQLLTLARLEPEDVARSFVSVRLSSLLREELAALAPLAIVRGQELDFLDEAAGCEVAGDAAMLGILVRNLVDNALRYSPDDSLVRVMLRRLGDGQVELRVLDEGPGVPPELAERVFERFFRARSGDGDGAGLGLAIVRRIAQLHGGSVAVVPRQESAPGGFRVLLPLKAGT